jgi:hypothetical protein
VTEYDQHRARDPNKKFEDKQDLQYLQNSIIQFVIKYETGWTITQESTLKK